MKAIKFKSFKDFQKMEFRPSADRMILYYSRVYGNRDWGFCVTGLFNEDLRHDGNPKDYIQVSFLTHDIHFYPAAGQIIANPKDKVITLEGITRENYETALKWIKENRQNLFRSVCELSGEYNPLADYLIQTEIDGKEVTA